jgi:hypothetical protein
MPEWEEKGTLIGTDQNIADAHRVMRKLVNTQEAWTGFVGKESTVMAEEVALMGSRGSSAAINLTPHVGGRLEELGVSSNSTKHIFTAGEAKGMTFTGGKVNSSLVHSGDVIVTLVHGVNALLIGSRTGREVADNGAQISHGGNIEVSLREGRQISIRRADRLEKVRRGTVLEGTGSG